MPLIGLGLGAALARGIGQVDPPGLAQQLPGSVQHQRHDPNATRSSRHAGSHSLPVDDPGLAGIQPPYI
jgi:hypothetical protein